MEQAQAVRQEEFDGLQLQIIEQNGEEWFSAEDIGKALGFAEPRIAVIKIFNRNREEFEGLYRVASLVTWLKSGGKTPRRFTTFNPAGAYLLAILARTPKSKALRRFLAKFMAHDLHRLKETVAEMQNSIFTLATEKVHLQEQADLRGGMVADLTKKLVQAKRQLEMIPKYLPAPDPTPYEFKDDDEVRVNFRDLKELVEHNRVSRYPNPTAFLIAALASQDAPNDPDSRQVVAGVQALLKILNRSICQRRSA